MSILENDFKNLKNYNEYLKEMAISDEELSKYDTFLRNIGDLKKNSQILLEDIDKIRSYLSNYDIRLKKETEIDNKTYYTVIYPKEVMNYFTYFKDILVDAEEKDNEIYKKYFNIIFPDNNEIYLDTEIEIEKNNFNRIHIPIGLPKVCKGVGVGKKIYLTVIKKTNYISTNKLDRNLDSIFVWDSLRKEKLLYSFLRKEQMLCFNIDCDFNYIKTILLDYFKYEIEDVKNNINNHQHIIDTDFREKYFKDILNSDLKYLIN